MALHPATGGQCLPERLDKGVRHSGRWRGTEPQEREPPDLRRPLRGGDQWKHKGREDNDHPCKKGCPPGDVTSHWPSPFDAEQLIERHIRPDIQYRWVFRQNIERQSRRNIQYRLILRHKVGEALSLPTGPTSLFKTHGRVSGSVTTTVTL